jgi:voltage-gated potassium channel
LRFPYESFFATGIVAVMTFAMIIRIWERPYYELTLD